jgi:hypothetical protein
MREAIRTIAIQRPTDVFPPLPPHLEGSIALDAALLRSASLPAAATAGPENVGAAPPDRSKLGPASPPMSVAAGADGGMLLLDRPAVGRSSGISVSLSSCCWPHVCALRGTPPERARLRALHKWARNCPRPPTVRTA